MFYLVMGVNLWLRLLFVGKAHSLNPLPASTLKLVLFHTRYALLIQPVGFSIQESHIISFPNPFVRDVLIAVQADLAKVGIQAKLDFPDWGKWVIYMGSGTS
jgi:hypothetical protein